MSTSKSVQLLNKVLCEDDAFYEHEQERAVQYYIYPKLKDIQKVFLTVIGIWWGYSVAGNAVRRLDAVIAFICVEFLLYAARYEWNDIRGFWEYLDGKDELKLRDKEKYRGFPLVSCSIRTDAMIAVIIMLVKLFAALVIAVGYFGLSRCNIVFVECCLLIIISALGYEHVRSQKYDKSYLVIIVVGTGYPLRVLAGFTAVGTGFEMSLNVFLAMMLVVIGLYFYGIMSAMIPWMFDVVDERGTGKKVYFRYLWDCVKEDVENHDNERENSELEERCKETEDDKETREVDCFEDYKERIKLGDNYREEIHSIRSFVPWKYSIVMSLSCFVAAIIGLKCGLILGSILEMVALIGVIARTIIFVNRHNCKECKLLELNCMNPGKNKMHVKIIFGALLMVLEIVFVVENTFASGIWFLAFFALLTYLFLYYNFNPYYDFKLELCKIGSVVISSLVGWDLDK